MERKSERIKRLLFCYAGSKGRLAPQLVRLFPPHKTYLSPFLGTGSEFVSKRPSLREIANDLDDNIYSVFTVLRDERMFNRLIHLLENSRDCRRLYEECYDRLQFQSLSNLDRAYCFLICGNLGYQGGHPMMSRSYASGPAKKRRLQTILPAVFAWRDRMKTVEVEHLDAFELLGRYDSAETFAFCDPPSEGLRPIVERFTASIWAVLGCTSNRYTIEAYFEYPPLGDDTLPELSGHPLVFFASPTIQGEQVVKLHNRHPAVLNWQAGAGRDVNEIGNLPANFFADGKRIPFLCFSRYAVVTIPTQCHQGRLGLLVLTAEQEEPFATNVLDTLDFLATIISAYFTKHEDCFAQRTTQSRLQHLEAMTVGQSGAKFPIKRATYGSGDRQNDVSDIVPTLISFCCGKSICQLGLPGRLGVGYQATGSCRTR
jgi:hypothetical protein